MSQTYEVLSDFYDRVTKREYKPGDAYPAAGTQANIFWINSLISGQNRAKRSFLKVVKVVNAKDVLPPAETLASDKEDSASETAPAPEAEQKAEFSKKMPVDDPEFEALRKLAKARKIKGWGLMRSSDTLRAALKKQEDENNKK